MTEACNYLKFFEVLKGLDVTRTNIKYV